MNIFKTFLTISSLVFAGHSQAKTYNFDVKKSKVSWVGSKVIGSKHNGTIGIKQANVTYGKKGPEKASVVIDMKSIVNLDITDSNYNKKLVGHLNSDDFFSVSKFPEAKLAVTKFTKSGPDGYKLKGNLTIKGITKPVEAKAKVMIQGKEINKIVADLEFDRTLYNVKYGSGKFFQNLGDKMISDKVQMKVELIPTKNIMMVAH